jgi:uncharacterized protein YjbI with pentapeptide repeats
MRECCLIDADLTIKNLMCANLHNSDLTNSKILRTNFVEANLTNAKVPNIDKTLAFLKFAKLDGTVWG